MTSLEKIENNKFREDGLEKEIGEISPEECLAIINAEEEEFNKETSNEIARLNSIGVQENAFERIKNEENVSEKLGEIQQEVVSVMNAQRSLVENNLQPRIITFNAEDGKSISVDLNKLEVIPNSEEGGVIKLSISHGENRLGSVSVFVDKDKGEARVTYSHLEGADTGDNGVIQAVLYKISKLLRGNNRKSNTGKGIGKEMYIKANEWLAGRNLKLASSTSRSNDSEFLWKSLEKKGLARKISLEGDNLSRYEFINPDR